MYDITSVHANRKRPEREYTETMHFLLYKIILKHSLVIAPTIQHCEIREKTRSSVSSYQENRHRKRPWSLERDVSVNPDFRVHRKGKSNTNNNKNHMIANL